MRADAKCSLVRLGPGTGRVIVCVPIESLCRAGLTSGLCSAESRGRDAFVEPFCSPLARGATARVSVIRDLVADASE